MMVYIKTLIFGVINKIIGRSRKRGNTVLCYSDYILGINILYSTCSITSCYCLSFFMIEDTLPNKINKNESLLWFTTIWYLIYKAANGNVQLLYNEGPSHYSLNLFLKVPAVKFKFTIATQFIPQTSYITKIVSSFPEFFHVIFYRLWQWNGIIEQRVWYTWVLTHIHKQHTSVP